MTELSVEEEYDDKSQGVEETNTENEEDEPLFLTKDDIPEYPGGQMSHAVPSYSSTNSPGRGCDAGDSLGRTNPVLYSLSLSLSHTQQHRIIININEEKTLTNINRAQTSWIFSVKDAELKFIVL